MLPLRRGRNAKLQNCAGLSDQRMKDTGVEGPREVEPGTGPTDDGPPSVAAEGGPAKRIPAHRGAHLRPTARNHSFQEASFVARGAW